MPFFRGQFIPNDPEEPEFPLRILFVDDGLVLVWSVDDYQGAAIEFYDSDAPDDGERIIVLDRCGRRVRIRLDGPEVVGPLGLYDDPPMTDEEIDRLLEPGRQRHEEWRRREQERREQSLWWQSLRRIGLWNGSVE